MDCHYFPQRKPAFQALTGSRRKLDDLRHAALKLHRTGRTPWRPNATGRNFCQPCHIKFISQPVECGRRKIHALDQGPRNQIPDEFPGLLCIPDRIFPAD